MFKKYLVLFFLFTTTFFSFAWKNKWFKNKIESGIAYTIFSTLKNNPKPIENNFLLMHLIKYNHQKKVVFSTHYFDKKNGVELQLKTPNKKPDIAEIFFLMQKKDSAIVKIPVQNNTKTKKDNFEYFSLKLFDFENEQQHQQKIETNFLNTIKTDSATIVLYLYYNSIKNYMVDSNRIYYYKTDSLPNSTFIQTNDSIEINYIGKLADGFEFDNSYKRNKPLPFVVGNNEVIRGLDIAIKYFKKGESGTILLPSNMAYSNHQLDKIPSNSVLIFDIKINK